VTFNHLAGGCNRRFDRSLAAEPEMEQVGHEEQLIDGGKSSGVGQLVCVE
jgi:hypothetical protein